MTRGLLIALATISLAVTTIDGLNAADSESPEKASFGNKMIRQYLAQEAAKIEAKLDGDFASLEAWQARRPRLSAPPPCSR